MPPMGSVAVVNVETGYNVLDIFNMFNWLNVVDIKKYDHFMRLLSIAESILLKPIKLTSLATTY